MNRFSLIAMLKRIADAAVNSAFQGLVNAFALKGVAVVLSFVFITLAARTLGEHDFGVFSILFSAAGLFSVFATAGQQILIMRSWNEYVAAKEHDSLKGSLVFGFSLLGLGSILMGAILFVGLAQLYPVALAGAVVAYMISLAAVLVSTHLVRAAIGVGWGDGLGVVGPLLLPTVALAHSALTGTTPTIESVFLMFTAGAVLAVLVHLILIAKLVSDQLKDAPKLPARFHHAIWFRRTLRLWLSNGLEATNQYVDVILIGWLLSPTLAGAYFLITRLANVFAMAGDALQLYATRHVPRLYFRGEMRELDQVLDIMAATVFAIVVSGLVLIVMAGSQILTIFNPSYAMYGMDLAILSIGPAAVAAAGASGVLLNFTGHESRNLRIIATTVALRVLGFIVLVPYLQIEGAILVTAVSFLLMAISLRNSARQKTGIDASILRLLPLARKLAAKPL